MRILAVTPWDGQGTPSGQACGIAQYAALLQQHLPGDLELIPDAAALDPARFLTDARVLPDGLWLNYHRGLHSRWTPEALRDIRAANPKIPVVVTFHDTYGESAPDQLTRDLYTYADAFVVHEPCVDLPRAEVIRQGIPEWPGAVAYDQSVNGPFNGRPILGTCGFHFPWKGFDRLAEVTAEAGWAYLVLSNNATEADRDRWQVANLHTQVITGFQPIPTIVSYLAGCDATAFPYQCANSGTSGAVRLGLAARKPVLAFTGCRQFRDLLMAGDSSAIRWCSDFPDLAQQLRVVPIQRVDPGVVALAERDSWPRQAARYAAIFRALAGGAR